MTLEQRSTSRRITEWSTALLCSVLVVIPYFASFPLPVADFGPGGAGELLSGQMSGVWAFFYGIFGILSFSPVWFANPVFWVGVILLAAYRPLGAMICGLIAVLLALTGMYPFRPEEKLLIGYYLWLTSMGLLFLTGACLSWLKHAKQASLEDSVVSRG